MWYTQIVTLRTSIGSLLSIQLLWKALFVFFPTILSLSIQVKIPQHHSVLRLFSLLNSHFYESLKCNTNNSWDSNWKRWQNVLRFKLNQLVDIQQICWSEINISNNSTFFSQSSSLYVTSLILFRWYEMECNNLLVLCFQSLRLLLVY